MDTVDTTRRQFVTNVGLAAAAVTILPRHVLGRGFTAPSDMFNVAAVGVGGRGRQDITNLASQNLVAMCDVDWAYAERGFAGMDAEIAKLQKQVDEKTLEIRLPASARSETNEPQFTSRPMTPLELSRATAQVERMKRLREVNIPKAKRYVDFREMLEKQKDIDGVVIATPDHLHATIALAAMDLGKHVYVEKPLTWSVAEARHLAKRAKETGVATQMGNQGRSLDDTRIGVEHVWGGTIGEVREVHVWTNRPLGFWPQGVPRPKSLSAGGEELKWNGPGVTSRLAGALAGNYPMPADLAWDLFLGPAPYVDYHPIYHPFNWRGWLDWGCGPIGDMGAHLLDVSMWALELGYPTTIETVSTPFNFVSFPHATTTFYKFPARGSRPAVSLTWYDGGLLPPKPVELGEEELNKGGGALLVGSKGKLLHETYGAKPRVLPQSLHEAAGTPRKRIPRVTDELHEMNWVEAAKGSTKATSPFEYAAKLTEVMLLGVVSLRAGKKIVYDAETMRVTNDAGANEFLSRQPRPGWTT